MDLIFFGLPHSCSKNSPARILQCMGSLHIFQKISRVRLNASYRTVIKMRDLRARIQARRVSFFISSIICGTSYHVRVCIPIYRPALKDYCTYKRDTVFVCVYHDKTFFWQLLSSKRIIDQSKFASNDIMTLGVHVVKLA